MFRWGKGGPVDKNRAQALLDKACKAGSKLGCSHLADMEARKEY
jgi:TPR repeat protein